MQKSIEKNETKKNHNLTKSNFLIVFFELIVILDIHFSLENDTFIISKLCNKYLKKKIYFANFLLQQHNKKERRYLLQLYL